MEYEPLLESRLKIHGIWRLLNEQNRESGELVGYQIKCSYLGEFISTLVKRTEQRNWKYRLCSSHFKGTVQWDWKGLTVCAMDSKGYSSGFLMWPDPIYFKYVLHSGSGHWTRRRLRANIFKCIISRDKLIFLRDARFNVFNRKVHIIREKEKENLGRNKMRRIRNVIGRWQ